MPDIGYVLGTPPDTAPQPDVAPRGNSVARRTALVCAMVAGATLAALATPAEQVAYAAQSAGPELTRLLRAMAGLKLTFGAALLAAAYWRLAVPAAAWWLAGYAVAGAATVAGPVLIWDMAHVGLGALLLHGGLLAGALLLWRDPAMCSRLAAVVSRRRAILRAQG